MKVGSLEIDLLMNIARLQGDMNKAQGAVQKSMANIERNIQRVQRAFGALGMGVGLGALTSQVTKLADSWQGLENRIRLVTSNQRELNRATEDIYRISQRSSAAMDSVGQVYQRFAENAGALGLNLSDVAELTDTVSKAVAISGASAQAAEAALIQFGQAMASAELRGEELRSVMEQTPGLARAIADGLNVPIGALRDLAEQGELTATRVIEALRNASDSVDEKFATRVKTVGQAFTELQNSLIRYVGQLSQSTGVTSTFADVISTLAENVDGIGRSLMFLAATAIPAAVRALWSLAAAMSAIPGMALVKVLSLAAGALLAFHDKLTFVSGSMDTLRLAWAGVIQLWTVAVDNLLSFLNTLGAATSSVLSLIGVEATASAGNFKDSFQSAFLAVAGFMDDVYAGFTGHLAAISAAFRATAQNIETWLYSMAEKATDALGRVAAALNSVLGTDISVTPFVGPGNTEYLDIIEEAKKAFQEGQKVLGMRDALVQAIAQQTLEGLNDAFDIALVDEQTGAIQKNTKSLTDNNKKLTEAQKAAAAFAKERQSALNSQYAAISAIHEEAQALEDQVTYFGLSKTAIEDLNIARLEEQATILRGFDGSEEAVEAIEREIEARQRLRTAIGSMEQKEAERAAWEDWARDVEQIFDRVGQSLTDAIFEGGKSGKDLLKDIFKSLTFNVLINPVMQGMQGWVTQNLGGVLGGSTQGGIMGLAQNASTLYSAVTGGLTSTLAAGAASIGSAIGSSALTSFAAGMKGSTLAAGLAGPTTAGATGAMGLGATLGAALPWIGGGLAIASIIGGGLFDREPTTRRQQRSIGEYSGGVFGIAEGSANQDAAKIAQDIAKSAVEAANDIFSQIGVDAAIDSFYAILETSYKRDRDGVASGGQLRVGDQLIDIGIPHASDMTLAGFGGWSDADIIPRLATDVQLTVLEAFQQLDTELPRVLRELVAGVDIRGLGEEEAQALAQRFSAIVQEVSAFQDAVEQLPFAQLRDLSFDAAANILSFAGGLENLTTNLGTYFSEFYSQEEQLQFATEQLGKAFSDLGLELPDVSAGAIEAKQAYRDIVESLDLNTESGQQAYATLINLSGGFAELVTGMDELNSAAQQAAQRLAERVASERYNLETQVLQLEGNTDELRRRQLETLDESNRALQEHIWALQDQAQATQDAALAAEHAAQAERDEIERQFRVADMAMQAAVSQLQTAYSAVRDHAQQEIARLSESFRGTDTAMRAYQSAVRDLESEFQGLFSSIEDGIRELRGGVESAAQYQYDQARAVISTALLTGQLPQTADLSEALRVAQEGVTGQVYASRADQERAYLRLANEMEAVKDLAEPELDAAQATLREMERQYNQLRGIADTGDASLATLERQLSAALATEANARIQIAGIEQQLDIALAQYNALLGIDSSITNLSSAVRAFAAAAGSVREAQSNPVNRDQRYYEAKLDQLKRTGSTTGGIDWTTASTSDLAAYFSSLGLTPEEHWKKHGRYEGLSYAIGTSYVPRDMLANIHQGEIIIDPRSSDILRRYGIEVQGGGEMVAELRQLRAEVAALRNEQKSSQFAIAKNTMKTAKRLDEFGDIGMPVREEITA